MLIIVDLIDGSIIETFPLLDEEKDRIYYATKDSWTEYKKNIAIFEEEQLKKFYIKYGTK